MINSAFLCDGLVWLSNSFFYLELIEAKIKQNTLADSDSDSESEGENSGDDKSESGGTSDGSQSEDSVQIAANDSEDDSVDDLLTLKPSLPDEQEVEDSTKLTVSRWRQFK